MVWFLFEQNTARKTHDLLLKPTTPTTWWSLRVILLRSGLGNQLAPPTRWHLWPLIGPPLLRRSSSDKLECMRGRLSVCCCVCMSGSNVWLENPNGDNIFTPACFSWDKDFLFLFKSISRKKKKSTCIYIKLQRWMRGRTFSSVCFFCFVFFKRMGGQAQVDAQRRCWGTALSVEVLQRWVAASGSTDTCRSCWMGFSQGNAPPAVEGGSSSHSLGHWVSRSRRCMTWQMQTHQPAVISF